MSQEELNAFLLVGRIIENFYEPTRSFDEFIAEMKNETTATISNLSKLTLELNSTIGAN